MATDPDHHNPNRHPPQPNKTPILLTAIAGDTPLGAPYATGRFNVVSSADQFEEKYGGPVRRNHCPGAGSNNSFESQYWR
jgi:hypothetical protein